MSVLPAGEIVDKIFLTGDHMSVPAQHSVRAMSCFSTSKAEVSDAGKESLRHELSSTTRSTV